jgi:hypothetical protein
LKNMAGPFSWSLPVQQSSIKHRFTIFW